MVVFAFGIVCFDIVGCCLIWLFWWDFVVCGLCFIVLWGLLFVGVSVALVFVDWCVLGC